MSGRREKIRETQLSLLEDLGVSEDERKFCDEYIASGFNQLAAYKAIGRTVTDDSARVLGGRYLKRNRVRAYLAQRLDEAAQEAKLSHVRLIQSMADTAFFHPASLFNADGTLIPLNELPHSVGTAIQGVKFEIVDGKPVPTEVKIVDKRATRADLARIYNLFEADNRSASGLGDLLAELDGRSHALPSVAAEREDSAPAADASDQEAQT
jgi:hypothetical protein